MAEPEFLNPNTSACAERCRRMELSQHCCSSHSLQINSPDGQGHAALETRAGLTSATGNWPRAMVKVLPLTSPVAVKSGRAVLKWWLHGTQSHLKQVCGLAFTLFPPKKSWLISACVPKSSSQIASSLEPALPWAGKWQQVHARGHSI